MPTTTKKRIIFRKKECQEKKTRESKEKEMKDGYKQNRQEKGEERERKCRCDKLKIRRQIIAAKCQTVK